MVTNSFGNRNFMQPMGRLSIHVVFGWMTGRMDRGRMTGGAGSGTDGWTEDGWTGDG